jgi:predicted ATPase
MESTVRHGIAGIQVERLFGLYNFRLGTAAGKRFDPQLILFYGDNGCGKTTILRLIQRTVSPEPNRGHRTALVQIPVQRFAVTLADGTEISVNRRHESLVGAYTWSLVRPGAPPHIIEVQPDADGVVKRSDDPAIVKVWASFEAELLSLGLSVYFLPDDRKLASDADHRAATEDDVLGYDESGRRRIAPRRTLLESAVLDLVNLLRSQVIRAGQTGEESINQIYMRVVRRLLWSKGRDAPETETHAASQALDSLATRSERFSALGLMPRLEFRELIEQIEKADSGTKSLITGVLTPYIESITARLDALASLQEVIETFVMLLNEFYAGKSANFDLQHGLRIAHPNKGQLPLDVLSSGEKQLLLLFCNTIRARTQANIFVVDEPELSLNVKWQRQLLQSLLALVKGTGVQFVIATHSIELLAGQRDSIIHLTSSTTAEGPTETWNVEQSPN